MGDFFQNFVAFLEYIFTKTKLSHEAIIISSQAFTLLLKWSRIRIFSYWTILHLMAEVFFGSFDSNKYSTSVSGWLTSDFQTF